VRPLPSLPPPWEGIILSTKGRSREGDTLHPAPEEDSLAKLISFDIDGTLEVGDPPGAIPITVVRRAQGLGYLVGSCSDRPISTQQRMWESHDIAADFTVLKHHLGELKERFQAEEYYHVGDTDTDRYYALQAGFHFVLPGGTLPV